MQTLVRFVSVGVLSLGLAIPAAFAAEELIYNDIETQPAGLTSVFLREGGHFDLRNVEAIEPGASAEFVTSSLGAPYYLYTLPGGEQWDYNINVPLPHAESDYLVCQYKVVMSPQKQVAETHWRRSLCEQAFATWLASQPSVEYIPMTFSADVLFGFDDARLTPSGTHLLRSAATDLKRDFERPVISLAGHTDRIGSEEYNQKLSESRANAVRELLIGVGLPGEGIRAVGLGESKPVVSCEGLNQRAALVKCLKPNRRVEVRVYEGAQSAN